METVSHATQGHKHLELFVKIAILAHFQMEIVVAQIVIQPVSAAVKLMDHVQVATQVNKSAQLVFNARPVPIIHSMLMDQIAVNHALLVSLAIPPQEPVFLALLVKEFQVISVLTVPQINLPTQLPSFVRTVTLVV